MAHFLGRLATSGDSEKGRVGREWRAQCANRGRARKQKSFNSFVELCSIGHRNVFRLLPLLASGKRRLSNHELRVWYLLIFTISKTFGNSLEYCTVHSARQQWTQSKPDRICNKEQRGVAPRRAGIMGMDLEEKRGEKERKRRVMLWTLHQKWSAPVLWGDI